MSITAHLQRLFDYDDWANQEVVWTLPDPCMPPRVLNLMGHILSAERLWLERLLLQKQTYPVWPDFTVEQCRQEASDLPGRWRAYIAGLGEDGLSRLVAYKNTKGQDWSSQPQDVLMHVVMHSAYHRGQIAAEMRAAGFVPPYTDFIHAVRQGLVD